MLSAAPLQSFPALCCPLASPQEPEPLVRAMSDSSGASPFIANFYARTAPTRLTGRQLLAGPTAGAATGQLSYLAASEMLAAEGTERMVLSIPTWLIAGGVVCGMATLIVAAVALLISSLATSSSVLPL